MNTKKILEAVRDLAIRTATRAGAAAANVVLGEVQTAMQKSETPQQLLANLDPVRLRNEAIKEAMTVGAVGVLTDVENGATNVAKRARGARERVEKKMKKPPAKKPAKKPAPKPQIPNVIDAEWEESKP